MIFIYGLILIAVLLKSYFTADEITQNLRGINKFVTLSYNLIIQTVITTVLVIFGLIIFGKIEAANEIIRSTDSTPEFIRSIITVLACLVGIFLLFAAYIKQKEFFCDKSDL